MTTLQPSPNTKRLFCTAPLLVIALLCGCSNSTVPPTNSPSVTTADSRTPAPAGPSSKELLAKMRGVYRDAKSYTDNASVVFSAVVRRTGSKQETPFTRASIAFERPNKLHVTYQKNIASPQEEKYEVVSNGAIVRSTANELPLQIHEAIAPLEFSAENFIPEPALRNALLENSIENTLPQLALLLVSDQDQTVFPGEDQARVLPAAELAGKSYDRVEIPSPAGKRVLWIDQDRFTLRRMELPIDYQREQLNSRNQFSRISVWIDFEEVTIDPEIESTTFQLAIPENARRVRRFIPPPPAGPSDSLQFAFTTLDGEEVTPETLAGKVTVLNFWSTHCPPCKMHTPVLNQIYQHFKDSEEVAFLAVSLDSPAVPNEVVANTLVSWGGKMPILRDLKSSSYYDLNVEQTPTMLLVDRVSRLQAFQTGIHRSPEPMIDVIERLLDGEDLMAVEREKHVEILAKYKQRLDAATITDSIVAMKLNGEIARPEVAPRRLPEKVRLEQLWQTSTEQVNRPGDVQVVADHVLVLDGGEAIVELDEMGKTVGRHELPEHDERAGGFLRSWSNDKGKRWTLASGVGWQQVFVFDAKWEPVLSFPDERHSGIGDVLFDDLTGSDTPVMHVGYWGGLGVQGGSLDGRRLWSNRNLDHVVQLGVGPSLDDKGSDDKGAEDDGGKTVWCSSTRGTLLQLGADGKPIRESYIEGQALMYFASQPDGESHCGLGVGKVGQYTAVGFDASGSVAWEYPLPPGEYVEQLPRVQSVVMPGGDSAWLIAAANGSLHWLSESGELLDRFDYGEILTGVAMHTVGDQTLLFVATAEHLSAWSVSDSLDVSSPSEPLDPSSARRSSPATDEPEVSESEEPSEPKEPSESDAAEPTED